MLPQKEIRAITDVIRNTVDCDRIYLFGSYAYGSPDSESDLDFYVVIPDDSIRPMEAIRMIYRNLGSIERTKPVDVMAARSSRFTEMSALPTMERQVAKEGVMLYERDGFGRRMV